MDVYDDLSIMHFPDITAVRLPQWNCAYLITPDENTESYRQTYKHNLTELDELCKQAKAKTKRTCSSHSPSRNATTPSRTIRKPATPPSRPNKRHATASCLK